MEIPIDTDLVGKMFRAGADFHEMALAEVNNKPIKKFMSDDRQAVKGKNMEKLTPLKAIRAKCVDCCGDNRKEVSACPVESCPLWKFRAGKRPKEGYDKSPLKTIRLYCLQCGELSSPRDVRLCKVTDCPLHGHRSGKTGRKLSKAEKDRRTAHLKAARKAKR